MVTSQRSLEVSCQKEQVSVSLWAVFEVWVYGALESPVPLPNPTVRTAGIHPLCVGRACFHIWADPWKTQERPCFGHNFRQQQHLSNKKKTESCSLWCPNEIYPSINYRSFWKYFQPFSFFRQHHPACVLARFEHSTWLINMEHDQNGQNGKNGHEKSALMVGPVGWHMFPGSVQILDKIDENRLGSHKKNLDTSPLIARRSFQRAWAETWWLGTIVHRGLAYWIWVFFAICRPLQKAGFFASDILPWMSCATFYVRWHHILNLLSLFRGRGGLNPKVLAFWNSGCACPYSTSRCPCYRKTKEHVQIEITTNHNQFHALSLS